MNKKKKTKIGPNKKLNIIIITLIAICVLFCLYKVAVLVQNPTDAFSVEQGKIYEEERAAGYIIREETIIKGSNYKNGMEQIKTEGERVAKGEAIFRYYSSGEESLLKKIAELDTKINEAMSKEDSSLQTSDIKALDKQIEDKLDTLQSENNVQTIAEIKKEIGSSVTKKAQIAGEYSPSGSYLKKLVDQRSKYENELYKGTERLNATISGVVSYKVDGYEDVFSSKNFTNLTPSFLEKLKLKTGQVVADSKESAKIINNFECYVACVLNSKQAKEAKPGQTVKLRLPNNSEVTSTISYVAMEEGGVVIVFKLDKQVQELISYRKISLDVIWWSDSGKKVPNVSIGYEEKGENKVAYVIRTRAGYKDKIWIKILRQNEKYAIVDNYTRTELEELGYTAEELNNRSTLTLYDEILKEPTQ